MNNGCSGVAVAAVAAVSLSGSLAYARDLTLEERVKAQEAIERIHNRTRSE